MAAHARVLHSLNRIESGASGARTATHSRRRASHVWIRGRASRRHAQRQTSRRRAWCACAVDAAHCALSDYSNERQPGTHCDPRTQSPTLQCKCNFKIAPTQRTTRSTKDRNDSITKEQNKCMLGLLVVLKRIFLQICLELISTAGLSVCELMVVELSVTFGLFIRCDCGASPRHLVGSRAELRTL